MNRILTSLFTLSLLAGLAVAGVSAQPLPQDSAVTFTLVSLSPETPYPGQEVVATVKYAGGSAGAIVKYDAAYEITTEGVTGSARCPGGCTLTLAAESGEAELKFYAPAEEGTYALTLSLTVGDAGPAQTLPPKALVVETALPPTVVQLFAGLGLFAAVMVIMALGTEAIIELGKVFLGLKSKVTAMEAFGQLKNELPGQLNQLGVDDATIKKLDGLYQGVTASLQPLANAADVYAQVRDGLFGDAFQSLKKIGALDAASADAAKLLAQYKEDAKLGLQRGLDALAQALPLARSLIISLRPLLLAKIDAVTIADAEAVIQSILKALQEAVTHDPDWTKQWLLSHANDLVAYNKESVLALAETGVFKTLLGLGFDSAGIDALRAEFSDRVEVAGAFVQQTAQRYADSIKGLLTAVENQRNEYQSPARKIWRRLRESRLTLPKSGVAVAVIVVLVVLALPQSWVWAGSWARPAGVNPGLAWLQSLGLVLLAGLVNGAVVGAVFWGAAALLQRWFAADVPGNDELNLPPEGTLGYFLRYVLERGFNALLGRGSSFADAQRYGSIDQGVQAGIGSLTPVTLAKTLLEREGKHQDEETSRVRLIRLISVVVGGYLAYSLKIDAAIYLDRAVPGIAGQINAVDLHALWSVIPRDLTVGMVLTGLAASAGSKFWRDVLGRLQAARSQAEEAAKMARNVQELLPAAADQPAK